MAIFNSYMFNYQRVYIRVYINIVDKSTVISLKLTEFTKKKNLQWIRHDPSPKK